MVSILILLDYLFLLCNLATLQDAFSMSQSLFYWIIYSYVLNESDTANENNVSILILLDYLFLLVPRCSAANTTIGLNPYFTGLSILMIVLLF